jgi:tetratricopeptide (TPR) repeat protein
MTAPAKMSPSQLAGLEQAFATAPSSEAWRPLAEAYLSMERHLEATVVAKKAARQRPGDGAPRLVLARVLAAQGKAEKARDELAEALRLAPGDPAAAALARELGLAPPGPAAGSAAPPAAGVPAAAADSGFRRRRRGHPPNLAPDWSRELGRRWADEEEPAPRRRRRAKREVAATIALALALGAGLAAIAAHTASRRAREIEVRRLLAEARPLLERDTWAAARGASDRCERALATDGGNAEARACAAWAAAVRWWDHGEGDGVRDEARRRLAGLEGGRRPARAEAAEALLRTGGGDPRGAADALRGRVESDPSSAALQVALGEALLAAGDLDAAREALSAAQRLAPGDVRALRLLADQFRRRGGADAAQAEVLYEIALSRLAPDHPGALLGRARLLLERRAHAEALSLADRVLASGDAASPRQRAVAQALRSRAYALAGRRDEARAAEGAARALDPAGASVGEILGAPLAATGSQPPPAPRIAGKG